MGFATHLGPWLLGTVKETTGTTAGTIRNTGVTVCLQMKNVAYGDTVANTTLAVLPAGSYIEKMQFLTTTAYSTTTPTFTFYVNGTAISSAVSATAFGNTGVQGFAIATQNPSLVLNVGTTDAVVSFTQNNGGGGTGAGTLLISYLVRAPDGAMFPASA